MTEEERREKIKEAKAQGQEVIKSFQEHAKKEIQDENKGCLTFVLELLGALILAVACSS